MASQGLKQVLSLLTPPPLVVPEDYDGLEYRWKFLVFRPGRVCTLFPSDSPIAKALCTAISLPEGGPLPCCGLVVYRMVFYWEEL